ncbi:phosphate ABC transporter permease subunit PstC [Synechococcus sp. PCC 7336]|uniref:phosphate ABC transporter permease subunit PstC n=1 Tax=Synechococcus sp. PCC 7336 TaxID=195250 RepID=UPI000348D28F|nr:phosphate ABC transporter permease subunit PstC [Synechococcus sp. PCC 7336]
MQAPSGSQTGLSIKQVLRRNAARDRRGKLIAIAMFLCAAFCVVITVGIVFILMETAVEFFNDELFETIGYLQKTTRQLAQDAGVSGADLSEILRKAVDTRDRTIERIADAIPNLSQEEFRATLEQNISSASGAERFWTRISTSFSRFFLDNRWTPLFASKRFGIWPLINGTVLVTVVAMLVATPLGLATAIYLGLYAPKRLATLLRPLVELLAGVPTVVYGYFALVYITPILRAIFPDTAIFNAASAGIMMGLMILPTVGSISLDAIVSVPRALHDGAYALGSTKMEVATTVVIPAAISGIAASIILGISRAVGETMIVTVAAGQQPILYSGDTALENLAIVTNPLQSIATMTAYIAQVSLGDAPQDSIEYRTLFAVGLVLFSITLAMNLISRTIASRIREEYD